MDALTFRIDGEFEDVHPYMNFLFLMGRDRSVSVVDLPGWISSLVARGRITAQQATAVLRSNQLTTVPGQPGLVELGVVPDEFVFETFELPAQGYTDWAIYNRTLYVSAHDGVHFAPLLINGTYDGHLDVEALIDVPAVQIRIKGAVVSVACGPNGLFPRRAFLWDMQSVSVRAEDMAWHADGYVQRLSWMDYDLLAFGKSEFSLYENESERVQFELDDGEGRTVITDFGVSRFGFDALMPSQMNFESGFAANKNAYVWNGAGVRRLRRDRGSFVPTKSFTLPAKRIFAGASFHRGLYFDTDVGTFHVAAQSLEPTLISAEENLVVRAFVGAKFYTSQVWSVKNEAIEFSFIPSSSP